MLNNVVVARKFRENKSLPELFGNKVRVGIIDRHNRMEFYLIDKSKIRNKNFKIGNRRYVFDDDSVIKHRGIRYIFYREGTPHPLVVDGTEMKVKADTLDTLMKLNFIQSMLGEQQTTLLLIMMLVMQLITIGVLIFKG